MARLNINNDSQKRPFRAVRANFRKWYLLAVLASALAMAGCGGSKAKSSQVAAKVNSEEITVSQLNNTLANVPVPPGKTADEVKNEVLDTLIVQKLAIQQAIKMKLDRTPATMQAIENTRNAILARAYFDPIMERVPKPSPEDVHKFYVEHPDQFSSRRVYTLRMLEVEAKPELVAAMRDMVDKGKGLDDVARWLKSMNVTPAIQTGAKPAEQFPQELLARLNKMSPSQSIYIESAKSAGVLQLVSTEIKPIEEKAAASFIQEHLAGVRRKEALEKEIKALKAAAKIEFAGDDKAKQAAPEAAKTEAQSGVLDVGKGVSGLK